MNYQNHFKIASAISTLILMVILSIILFVDESYFATNSFLVLASIIIGCVIVIFIDVFIQLRDKYKKRQ
jgi:uncharacterized membrane protein YkvI